MVIKKTITITEEQEAWVKENSINLSRFVQKRIQKEIMLKKQLDEVHGE